MINITVHTDSDSKRFQIPELSDLTLRDMVEYAKEVGNHQPGIMTELTRCHDPIRRGNIEKRHKEGRLDKARYRAFIQRYYNEVEACQEEKVKDYGGWDKVNEAEMGWVMDNLKYFVRDDDNQPISDYYLSNIPVTSNDPNVVTIYNLFGFVEHLMGGISKEPDFNSFEIDGQTYFLPAKGFSKSTMGEYIERQHMILELERMERGEMEALPRMIALLCRRNEEPLPVDADDRDAFIDDRAQVMMKLEADKALQVAFFFAKQTAISTGVFRASAQKQKRGKSSKRAKRSSKNMGGTVSSIGLRKVAGSTVQT